MRAVDLAHVKYLRPLLRAQWADSLGGLRALSASESPAIWLVSALGDDTTGMVPAGDRVPVLPVLYPNSTMVFCPL